MSARAAIHAMFPLDEASTAELDLRLDAHRAEVLAEGAEAIDVKQDEYEAEERQRFGHLDHETVLQREAVRDMAALLRQMADEGKATAPTATATPDFYQVGHTYTEPDGATDWRFRVDHIATHPEDGERTAIGWRHFRGEWDVYAYGEDDFEIHRLVGYVDATEAGGSRG
jgi:hypothetical protein